MNPISFHCHAEDGPFRGLNEINDSFTLLGIDIILLNKILMCVVLNENLIKNDRRVPVYIDVEQIFNKAGEVLEEMKNSGFRIINIDSTFQNFMLEVEKYNINYTVYGLYKSHQSIRRVNQIYPLKYFNQLQTITLNGKAYKIPPRAEKLLEHLFNDWKSQITKNNIDSFISEKVEKNTHLIFRIVNAFKFFGVMIEILKIRVFKKQREPLFIHMLDSAICDNLSIIETGSSDGRETEYILKNHPDKNLSIYVVEPDKKNIEKVKKKNKYNDQIQFFNLGMSNKNEFNYFYKSKVRPNLNSAIPNQYSSEKIKIQYTTLDTFIKENKITTPLLIKMDIEGFEVEVLEGFLDFAKHHSNIKILMEVHPNTYSNKHSIRRVMEKLHAYGFRFKYIESAGTPHPKRFEEKGYRPFKILNNRGLYKNIDHDFAINAISKNISDKMKNSSRLTLKIVRSVLLEKI